MSKIFKILLLITLICLSCTAFFACGGGGDESVKESEKVSVSESEKDSESESLEESEEESESVFDIELPEVGRN